MFMKQRSFIHAHIVRSIFMKANIFKNIFKLSMVQRNIDVGFALLYFPQNKEQVVISNMFMVWTSQIWVKPAQIDVSFSEFYW